MAVTLDSYEGLAKRVHGKLKDVVPDYGKYPFISKHPIDDSKRIGKEYCETVSVRRPAGFTNSPGGLAAMEAPSSGATAEATGRAWDLILRDHIAFDILYSAAREGDEAFAQAYGKAIMEMKDSMFHRLELNAKYGARPMAVAASGDAAVTASSGTATVSVAPGTFIPAAFVGSNPWVDVWDNNGGTYTLLNELAPVKVTGVSNPTTSSVTLTLSGNATDMSDIDTAQLTRPVEIWFRGSRNATTGALVETHGLGGIAALTSGDTYLGVSVSAYPTFWSGSRQNASGSLTISKLVALASAMSLKGAEGDLMFECSHPAYDQIAAEARASNSLNIRTQANHDKQVIGSDEYEVRTSIGPIAIKPSKFVPLGSGLLYIDDEHLERVGSAEDERTIPGASTRLLQPLQDLTGIQLVSYSHARVWCTRPANVGELYGITFS